MPKTRILFLTLVHIYTIALNCIYSAVLSGSGRVQLSVTP